MNRPAAAHALSTVVAAAPAGPGIFRLDCAWPGPPPRAGQFFMLKPRRSAVFLPRPVSAALWEPLSPVNVCPGGPGPRNGVSGAPALRLVFYILRRGRGTEELASLRPGDELELSGPLGNFWREHTCPAEGDPGHGGDPGRGGDKPLALVGGGIGAAPLIALAAELAEKHEAFDFYAGFRIPFSSREEQNAFLGPAERYARRLVIAVEEAAAAPDRDGEPPLQGLVPAFLDPGKYRAVCACGPEAMLRAVADKCAAAAVPCHVSLERRMACGVGACLGCTVPTAAGNRRCCTDGPVFSAEAITL